MIYKQFKDIELSCLGIGTMRLPTKSDGFGSPVNEDKAIAMLRKAYENGVNYFDTAFPYHGGNSEVVLGKALKNYPRKSFYLADKFWYQSMSLNMTFQEFFEIQLKRCGVDYFDFYMIHNVADQTIDDYFKLDKTKGMFAYFEREKRAGRIRHLGFSSHANPDNMIRFLDYYPGFEFVQIQCNYIDWTLQDAKQKYEILTERKLPVMVMESCRGGALAALGKKDDVLLKAERPDKSIASWAYRYLQGLPNVQVILSGVSSLAQLEDNLDTFSKHQPLTEKEQKIIAKIVATHLNTVPCTACHYCYDCPKKLDISKLISVYNEISFDPKALRFAKMQLAAGQNPRDCIDCGKCIKACPQGIDTPGIMKALAKLW